MDPDVQVKERTSFPDIVPDKTRPTVVTTRFYSRLDFYCGEVVTQNVFLGSLFPVTEKVTQN